MLFGSQASSPAKSRTILGLDCFEERVVPDAGPGDPPVTPVSQSSSTGDPAAFSLGVVNTALETLSGITEVSTALEAPTKPGWDIKWGGAGNPPGTIVLTIPNGTTYTIVPSVATPGGPVTVIIQTPDGKTETVILPVVKPTVPVPIDPSTGKPVVPPVPFETPPDLIRPKSPTAPPPAPPPN